MLNGFLNYNLQLNLGMIPQRHNLDLIASFKNNTIPIISFLTPFKPGDLRDLDTLLCIYSLIFNFGHSNVS
jgi:hypothetical protein